VLLGESGVGKSTLLNALAGGEIVRTAATRRDGEGRHTTAWRELVALPGGGVLIDTPGLRRLLVWDAEDGVSQAFADVEGVAAGCRFRDCAHGGEPGCAVADAVTAGTLPARRLASYQKVQRELAWLERRHDARLRAEANRRWKVIHKQMRGAGRQR
jgi:ribosome biogenesis GTPase